MRKIPLFLLFSACAFATPLEFTGEGWFNGTDAGFDLTGDGFWWHLSSDIPGAVAACSIGTPCDPAIVAAADSSSDTTSVYGVYKGTSWGFDRVLGALVFGEITVLHHVVLGSGVEVGERFDVPVDVSGAITGPNFHLNIAGRGVDTGAGVFDRTGPNATLFFTGPVNFEGTMTEAVPEPAAWGPAAAGLAAFAASRLLRRRRARLS